MLPKDLAKVDLGDLGEYFQNEGFRFFSNVQTFLGSTKEGEKETLLQLSHRHGNFSFTTILHLTRVECHQVPRVPRKTTWPHLLTRRKRHAFATFPIGTATFTLRSVKMNAFLRVFLWTYCKIDVSCEASVDFHDMSQNATPATEFAPCHHFAQRWQCNSQKTRNTTGLKCCVCHGKWHRRCPKYCACNEKCNKSLENVAKALRLPHKTTFGRVVKHVGMSQSATLATQNDMTTASDTSKSHVCATFPIGTATLRPRRPQTDGWGRLQTVADGCKRLRTPEAGSREHGSTPRPHPQTPKCKTRTLRYAFGNQEISQTQIGRQCKARISFSCSQLDFSKEQLLTARNDKDGCGGANQQWWHEWSQIGCRLVHLSLTHHR